MKIELVDKNGATEEYICEDGYVLISNSWESIEWVERELRTRRTHWDISEDIANEETFWNNVG